VISVRFTRRLTVIFRLYKLLKRIRILVLVLASLRHHYLFIVVGEVSQGTRITLLKISNKTCDERTMKRNCTSSDCNPDIGFSIPEFWIEKFVIPGSCFGIRLTDWSLFWYSQLTYFMHRAPTKGISEL